MKNDNINNIRFLSGDEALAQGAYEAGLLFAASYPGTPATEVLEYISKFKEIDAQWSVNEKVAFEVALASSIAGKRSIYASKHVGLNVAMDPLMTSTYTGVGAGFVIVCADDPGIHSSQNEQDTRLFARVAKLPLLEPSSPREAKEFIKRAFEISEKFDTPVMVRLTTRIAHTKENVIIEDRKEVGIKEYKTDIAKYVMVPRNAYNKHIQLEKKILDLQDYSNQSDLNTIEINDKKLGIITSGITYLHAKEIFPDASYLKIGLSYPLPDKIVKAFAKKVKNIFILEELEPFLENQIKLIDVKFKAKHPSYRIGEIRPENISDILKGKPRVEEVNTTRRPMMCAGCPHRSVYTVLKKLKANVTGDIGCYTLGALPPLGALHTCLCMGAGITFFEGFKKVLGKDVVGVIGDSTFVHSGVTGLINAAYNKTKGLIIILDNSTTAMTGNQPHPATGTTIKQESTKRLILEDLCKVCGADSVDVVSAYDIKNLETLIKQKMNADQLSVIIARTPCRLLIKEKLSDIVYNKEKCKKCYVCLSVGCPAIIKKDDGFVEVVEKSCIGCGLCVDICPFKALEKK